MRILLLSFLYLGLFMAPVFGQTVPYSAGLHSWDADSLGNHRAIVQFNGSGQVAKVRIPWRRRDPGPEDKRIIVQDIRSGQKIANVKAGPINQEAGVIYFEPVSGRGSYAIYYMPSKNEGRSNYPKGVYLKPENTASDSWTRMINDKLPFNTITRGIEAIDSFNSFYPMEVIATRPETDALLHRSGRNDFLVFPEDRMHPIRMTDHLPYRWIQKGAGNSFSGTALKGEYFFYQLGIFAIQDIQDMDISFTALSDGLGHQIGPAQTSCLNNSGIDYRGQPFHKTLSVDKNMIQALWCGIEIPNGTVPGKYQGTATIRSRKNKPTSISIVMTVLNQLSPDGGISDPSKQTRLKWLNSVLYQDNEVIRPYTPLKREENRISLLGRRIELNQDGLPAQIQTYFSKEMTDYINEPNNILAAPIRFQMFSHSDSEGLVWKNLGLEFTGQSPGTISWKATSTNAMAIMELNASIEFDGFMSYNVKITALADGDYRDISMLIPFKQEASKYMMGLGRKGGIRPDHYEWKWDVATRNQDGAWIGNVNAGLQYSLRDENYVRPLNTNFYLQKPLLLPVSWGNNNKGGIDITGSGNQVIANNYSGERQLKKGDILYFNFNLLITPFHTINTDFQWQNRFYHKYDPIDSIRSKGATIINIHHATPINPWINYPFIEYRKMKAYIDEAHSKGLKVKIYNTVREVSDRAYETFAMRSLGHEIYSAGKGGGFRWLQEHLGQDYIAAWFVPEIKDAAIVNSGMSRWHNYYVEGMNWLVQKVGIDGIYLDDVAFDRVTMKRIKRALTQGSHPGIIDLHSANQYNRNDGFNNSANLYMEHFPYLNRLWFGEYFDYNNNEPDFFLTEVSGIPFGLMGEMLQDGGNPWRGMVYGMTNRMPWSDDADPRPIWKVWDDFGMLGTKMIGYWSDKCPVKTSHPKVLATVYMKNGAALVSIGSWAGEKTMIQLSIDWQKLGINPLKATITAPAIANFQNASGFQQTDIIPIEKGKGLILIIRERKE